MTTQTEALKLALEALEVAEHFLEEYAASKYYFAHIAAITAIKEALAQPETYWERVARIKEEMLRVSYEENKALKEALAQPEHDKERCVGCEACIDTACGRDECPKGWPKAAQPEQEPVATDWERIARVQNAKLMAMCNEVGGSEKLREVMDKYAQTTPPQRTWVGLTDEETAELVHRYAFYELTRQIEAKLKEKNA